MHDRLPLVVFPRAPGADLGDHFASLRLTAERYLPRLGSILFRGFGVERGEDLRRFAGGSAAPLEAATHDGVELGHARASCGAWPLRAWLCATGATLPGWTFMADGREVFRALPKSLRARFVDRGLMQVQRIALEAGTDRAGFEAAWRTRGASVEWLEPGVALTRRRVPAVIAHPLTHDLVWLADVLAPAREGKELVHADGSVIESSIKDEIEAAFDDVRVVLEWEPGDVLLLDNLTMAVVHVAPEGRGFTPALLLDEATFSPSADDVRWVETPRPGPRRVDVSDAQRALAAPCRSWA
jgi:hypothetical protein